MIPKVMAYFFRNDHYLKADVYDKVTMPSYLLFFLTEMKYKGKIFYISQFPINHSNTVFLPISGFYKLGEPYFSRGEKSTFSLQLH